MELASILNDGGVGRRQTYVSRLKEILDPLGQPGDFGVEASEEIAIPARAKPRIFALHPVERETRLEAGVSPPLSGNGNTHAVERFTPMEESISEQVAALGELVAFNRHEKPTQPEPSVVLSTARDAHADKPAMLMFIPSEANETAGEPLVSGLTDQLHEQTEPATGDDFMGAFTSAVREVQKGLDQAVDSALDTMLAMSSELRSLGRRFDTLRRDVDLLIQQKERPALDSSALHEVKRSFEDSQQRTMDLVMSLAEACNESNRLMGAQTDAVAGLKLQIAQIQEEMRHREELAEAQAAAAASEASALRERLETTEGFVRDLCEHGTQEGQSSLDPDQRLAVLDPDDVAQAEFAPVLCFATQEVEAMPEPLEDLPHRVQELISGNYSGSHILEQQ